MLDTAGNLIVHLGRYGNCDSGFAAKSKLPIGGDHIAVFIPRFISGTVNCLCFSEWGERLVTVKIACHAEEPVAVGGGEEEVPPSRSVPRFSCGLPGGA